MLLRKIIFLLCLLCAAILALLVIYNIKTEKRFAGPPILQEVANFSKELVDELEPTSPVGKAKIKSEPFKFDNIFAERSITEEKCDECTTLLVTGDVLTARTVNQKTTQLQNFKWPFEKTADVLRAADITFINLETPLVPDCPIKTDGMVFCGDQKNVEGLQFAGVDVVTYANNHAGNAGKSGVDETVKTLRSSGMLVTGVDGPVVKEVHGVKFGFVGLNDVEKYGFVADVTGNRLSQEIQAARQKSDVVIVEFHWGEEYQYQPTQRQRQLAREAINAGADLVVGNHPHWLEPAEMYKDKLIVYSHGNFVFDQMWSEQTREGLVGKYTFKGTQLVDVAFFPVYIENYGQPRWMEGQEKSRILDLFKRESEKLKDK